MATNDKNKEETRKGEKTRFDPKDFENEEQSVIFDPNDFGNEDPPVIFNPKDFDVFTDKELIQKLIDSEEKNKELIEELNQLRIYKHKSDTLQTDNNLLTSDLKKLEKEKTDLLQKIDSFKQEIKTIKSTRDAYLSDKNNLNRKVIEKDNAIAYLNKQIKEKEKMIDELNNKIKELNNREPKTKEVKVARNIWMPWVIAMTLLFFAEVAVFGVCLNNMFNYVDNTLLIIALAVISFTIVLLAIVNVVHFAKQEYFRYNHKKAGSVFLWIILALLVTGGAFLSIFSPILFIQ